MPAESARLAHQPLTAPFVMRLLRGHRDADDDAWRFTLENVSISAAGRFVYLTLAVDESGETEAVQINRGAVVIPKALLRALQSLAAGAKWNVWVEDICVDPNDLEDRSLHITLRPHLLRAADQVICYTEDDRVSAPSSQQLWRSIQAVEEAIPEGYAEAFGTLRSFFGRPAWDRMELLQEVSMGQSSILYQGSYFEWKHVGPALWGLQSRREDAGEPSSDLAGIFCINNVWHRWSSSRIPSASSTTTWKTSTLDAVAWSAPLRTKDPRDRLFRLFGVCFDAELMLLRPSYGDSVEKVYTDFARAVIDDSGPEALCLVAGSRLGSAAYARRLPSWVPDWDNLSRSPDPEQKDFVKSYAKHKTERPSTTARYHPERPGHPSPSLSVSALVVGKLDGITSAIVAPQDREPATASSSRTNAGPRDPPSGNEEMDVVGSVLGALLCGQSVDFQNADGRVIGNPGAYQITRRCFRHLCARGSLAAVGDARYRAQLVAWLEANAPLMIRGQSLAEWSRAAFHLHPSAPDFYYVPDAPAPDHFAAFLETLRGFFDAGCRLFVTDTGEVGTAEGEDVRRWDKVCWIRRSKASYLLREVEGGTHTLVGPVHLERSYLSTPPKRYAGDGELRDGDWGDFTRRGYWTEEMELV